MPHALIFIALLVATTGAHLQNLVAMKHLDVTQGFVTYMKTCLIVLPISMIVSMGFAYYYANGVKSYPYFVLSIMALGASIVFSFSINQLILNQRNFNAPELIGVALILIGVGFVTYSKV
ncbi:hypothetical protein LMH73_008210 [Vibrio splendidus]|nr:hypothetical protein [Vibrio splendidus]MCC4880522.1 hypothetical protein [Vibrio splendidus]